MSRYKTIFTTERSPLHQRHALHAAPDVLDVIMLRNPSREDLSTALHDASFLISERVGVIDRDLLVHAPSLKLIVRLGSLDHDIDYVAAQDMGIIVHRQSDYMVMRVAEHTVMQILATLKNVRYSESVALSNDPIWRESQRTDENTFAYNWAQLNDIQQLYGKTVGIVGFGEIGAELARRLQGWDCTLLYHKRRQLPAFIEDELRIQYTDIQSIFQQSNIVVNLLPYFPETDMLINRSIIDQMKPNSLLVSVGSDSVIDEVALADAVRSGHLAGVALDTFEYEPLRADNALRQLALDDYNVLLTPHTAAVGQHDAGRKADYAYIMQFLQGDLS